MFIFHEFVHYDKGSGEMIKDFNEIDHELFMREALKEGEEAGKRGDKPIGAVIVHNGIIISRGANRSKTQHTHVGHAENTAILNCASYLSDYGRECIIYTTVEPCVMCLGTIVMANIRSIVFAVEDKYMNMKPYIDSNPYLKKRVHNYLSGVLTEESFSILKKYAPDDAEIIMNGIR